MICKIYNEDAGKQRMGKYLSAAAVATCGMVGHAKADIVGSTTPETFDTSTFSSASFFGGKIRVWAQSTGVKMLRGGGRFAVNTTLQNGDALSGYSFNANTTSSFSVFYNAPQYVTAISNYSSATSPTLAAGTHLIGLAHSPDIGKSFYYGWFDYTLTFDGSGGVQSFVINSWAYNDTADEGILMGQQQSSVPGIGGLAALALGAAGVRGRRQRVMA